MNEVVPHGGWVPPERQRGHIERLDKGAHIVADWQPRRRMTTALDVLIPEPPIHDEREVEFNALNGYVRWTLPNEVARQYYSQSLDRIRHDHLTWPKLKESTL